MKTANSIKELKELKKQERTEAEIAAHNKEVRLPNITKHRNNILGGLSALSYKVKSSKATSFTRTYIWAVSQTPDKDVVFDIALIRGGSAEQMIEELNSVITKFKN